MKFMVQFRLKAGDKRKAMEAFEQRGPNRMAGVIFRGAWIGARADVVFALVESSDEALISQAAQAWKELGDDPSITEVIDLDQF